MNLEDLTLIITQKEVEILNLKRYIAQLEEKIEKEGKENVED